MSTPRWLRRLLRRNDGSATVEFCLLFPAFMVLLISSVEAGVLLTRQMALERGLDMTMRQLRLGIMGDVSFQNVRKQICARAGVLPKCEEVLMLELSPVSKATFNIPLQGNRCVNRNEELNPVTNYVLGGSDELMLVRACVVFSPIFPATGLGANMPLDASGGYRLMATSAFVNEP